MSRLVRVIACAAVCTLYLFPANGRDLIFTIRNGQTITLGPWYHMAFPYPPCRMVGTPHVVIVTKPQDGSLSTKEKQAKPARPEQLKSCPNLNLTHVNVLYVARKPGTEKFSFMIDYNPLLPGDWLYNVTVQIVE